MEILPTIGITIGDPFGIGPEIVLKSLQCKEIQKSCKSLVIGDYKILEEIAKNLGVEYKMRLVKNNSDSFDNEFVNVFDVKVDNLKVIKHGQISEISGNASYQYIKTALKLVKQGYVDAITTAPITKESLKKANIPYIDHTQILNTYCKGKPITLLATQSFKVSHVLRHLSLKESIANLNEEKIFNTIIRTYEGIKLTYGQKNIKLLVAGLNPHNGEGGLLGDEENIIIKPAIKRAQKMGINVEGPIAADSVFPIAINNRVDSVIAMYHDQGHIAIKANDWKRSYTVTIGIDVIRTAPNHGSALDIADKFIASEKSMIAAINEALAIARIKQ